MSACFDADDFNCSGSIRAGRAAAPDGAAIYKERCASCHDMPQGRVPALGAIKAMSGEAIYVALTTGAMKTQAQGMSIVQIFTLLGYIGPTGGAAADTPSDHANLQGRRGSAAADFKAAMNAPRWNGWSTSVTNSRFQDASQRGSHGGAGAGTQIEVGIQSGSRDDGAIPAGDRRWTRVPRNPDRSRVLAGREDRLHVLGIQNGCRRPRRASRWAMPMAFQRYLSAMRAQRSMPSMRNRAS